MKKFMFVIVFVFAISFSATVFAHQPNIVNYSGTKDSPIIIDHPEISKAYYGELVGEPSLYELSSSDEFNLYVNVLSPDIKEASKDYSVSIYKDGNLFKTLDGLDYEWESFYEHFAGDNYFKGPELDYAKAPSGLYEIVISSPDNNGKYVLAVGKIEKFGIMDTIRTIFTLPNLKSSFFEKSILTSYSNYIGIFILLFFTLFSGLIYLIFKIVKKIRNQ